MAKLTEACKDPMQDLPSINLPAEERQEKVLASMKSCSRYITEAVTRMHACMHGE